MKINRWASGSSVVAGALVMVSSACCIGPLAVVLSMVGLGSGTLLAVENVVGPFRPAILILTALALAMGFYAAYRKAPCAEGKACAVPGSRRLQRVVLWLATGLLLVLLYFTYVHPNFDLLFDLYL